MVTLHCYRFYSLLACLLAGCASTGVVQMGQNLHTISKTSPACGFRDAGGVKADIFAEMMRSVQQKSYILK
jgi:hypothetical protein